MSNYFWSEQEDTDLLDFIENGGYTNISKAIKAFSENSDLNTNNRSFQSCAYRYNRYLKKGNRTVFMTATKNGGMINTKHVKTGNTPDIKPVEVVLRYLLDLPVLQRRRILEIFLLD